jgi:hypothetical protein
MWLATQTRWTSLFGGSTMADSQAQTFSFLTDLPAKR